MASVINVSVGGSAGSQNVRATTAAGARVGVSPGSVVYVGKSPYINEETGTWMVYNDNTKTFVDSGVVADASMINVSEEFVIDEDGVLHIYEVDASKITGLPDALLGVSADGVLLPIADSIVDIPVATMEALGLVRSAAGENKVSVDTDGRMSVNSLNINKVEQTAGEKFTLNAGSSAD